GHRHHRLRGRPAHPAADGHLSGRGLLPAAASGSARSPTERDRPWPARAHRPRPAGDRRGRAAGRLRPAGPAGVRPRRSPAGRGHSRRRARPHASRGVAVALRRAGDLSTPRTRRVSLGLHHDPEAFGRFSEAIARTLGTARFLVIQTVVVVLWIIFNAVAATLKFDPYPFILLNLAFSTQAAYAAPLILLAQNRQDERDRSQIEVDRQ